MLIRNPNAAAPPSETPDVPNDMSEHVLSHCRASTKDSPLLSISAETGGAGTTILRNARLRSRFPECDMSCRHSAKRRRALGRGIRRRRAGGWRGPGPGSEEKL